MNTVIITGASSGIGKEIAHTFANKGWKCFLVARSQDKLEALASELPNTVALSCDLTDSKAISNLAEGLSGQTINALINNAGVFKPQTVDEDSDDVWDWHYQANLMSAVRLTRALWPQLVRSKGVVLNISSTLGMRPIANTGAYSALKAAMNNWTQTLAIEGAAQGVRANCICPGIVDTPIHSYVESQDPQDKETYKAVQGAQPLGRTGKPQDIAFMAYQLCQDEAAWTTGAILNIDGGILLNS